MDTTYYVIYGMLLLLSVFGLVVGVSNDAWNFLNSSLADRAWGRDSAVYRITGVLTVIGGSFLTALAAFIVAIVMAYGGFWGMITMLVIAGPLLIKSTFFTSSSKDEIRLINMASDAAVKDFGKAASGRLGRMVGIYNAMVKALLSEDRDALKRLRKKSRHLMHSTADESGRRNGILYLTLLNETRAMLSHAFALIERVKELYED